MSSTRSFVYDLDGTLIDSKPFVFEAYRLAGIEMPPEMWGKPWHVWCGIEEHSLKVKVYQEMMDDGIIPVLPAAEVLRAQLLRGEDCYILTGAAHEAVWGFIKREKLVRAQLLGWSATEWHKKNALARLSQRTRRHITYVDDDAVAHIVPSPGAFVQYTGQDKERLMEDIQWT